MEGSHNALNRQKERNDEKNIAISLHSTISHLVTNACAKNCAFVDCLVTCDPSKLNKSAAIWWSRNDTESLGNDEILQRRRAKSDM
jgi:hypothetical protein